MRVGPNEVSLGSLEAQSDFGPELRQRRDKKAYLMKPSLELRSHSKKKISNIWSFFLYIIWMIRSPNTTSISYDTCTQHRIRVRVGFPFYVMLPF